LANIDVFLLILYTFDYHNFDPKSVDDTLMKNLTNIYIAIVCTFYT